jgi:hypothetical protein
MLDVQAICVRNNAEFCDRICRSHAVPGVFERSLWIQKERGPAFYPNVITLTRNSILEQTARISALHALRPDIGIKDSFRMLDLSTIGMRRLFDAEWVWMDPEPSRRIVKQPERWGKVESVTNLEHWQAAWRENDPVLTSPVFLPTLLDDPSIIILAAWHGTSIVAGCILHRDSFNVAGLSNLFANEASRDRCLAAAVDQAIEFTEGSMLVGYDRGEDLMRMHACGFRSAGPLCVWV